MRKVKIGDEIIIYNMKDEPKYTNKIGVVEMIDDSGQLFGTWGSLAVIPEVDDFDIIGVKNEKEERK